MKKFSLLFCLAFLFSCNENKKKTGPEVKVVDMEQQIHAPAKLQVKFGDDKVGEIYKDYIEVKSALVNSNMENTREAAKSLSENLRQSSFSNKLLSISEEMTKMSDLEKQREAFQYLTEEMLRLVEANIDSGQLYYQYCPMAFQGKGGYWLSNGKEIRNPYFGDRMLKCGKVEKTIQ